MEQVVVWPGVNDPGWINLHCHLKNGNPAIKGGKDFVIGWPFKTVDELMSRAVRVQGSAQFFDCWFCTSQQRTHDTSSKTGKPKAKRHHSNATWLKALWVDVDVKPKPATWDAEHPGEPWTHYETVKEAWGALAAFRTRVGLPYPSAVVNSGGGLHVYWISDAPLTPADWRPYAEGLKGLLLREGVKCDTGLTTDDVRILRIPGTLNHKYSPPRPVNLVHLGQVYKFETALAFLKTFKSVNEAGNKSVTPEQPSTIPSWASSGGPNPAFAGLTGGEALAAGVEKHSGGPFRVDPEPIFEQCGFLREARATGGKDYDNPLWNLSVLCTAFMENGDVLAHEISKGHATYSAPDTQALYDRKVADRVERGIGYPSCATIAGAGCKACATCPLFPNGKSPLNIRRGSAKPRAVTATVTGGPVNLLLPDNYVLDANGIICELVRNKDDEEIPLPLFHSTIYDAWLQKEPDVIHLRCSYDKGNTIWTAVRVEDMMGPGYEKKLGAAKLLYTKHKARLETFFMAWVDIMRRAAEAQTPQAFGWYRESGAIKGFAYGGFIHRDDGTSAQAGLTDKVTQKRFSPAGELSPWHKAAGYILRQKRAELDVVIATSFAAPLIQLTGTTGAMVSAWGVSGVGKTYALEVGAAVWGHPKESKEVTSSTWKSVERRLASTVNLPVYWDEITNEPAQKNVFEMLMLSTGGVRGGRLKQNTEQMEKGTWSTLVSINSNLCFKEYVARCQPTHTAGLNRVLEYQVLHASGNTGQASPSEAAQALAQLDHHYGNVGFEYAKVLGSDHVAVQARLDAVLANLEKTLQPTPEDRFWVSTIATIIVGAEIARDRLEVPFDLERIITFLLKVFDENKKSRIDANVNPNSQQYATDFLTAFLKDHTMSSIWVDYTPAGAGRRPQPTAWKRLFPNSPLPNGVQVRYDQTSADIMLSRRALANWLKLKMNDTSLKIVLQSLANNYGAVEAKKTLSAGTPIPGGQEPVVVINAGRNPELMDEVMRQMPDQSLGASTGMSAAVVDTGITPADEQVTPNASS